MARVLNNPSQHQNYGEDPQKVRETDKYKEEYVHRFVEKWDDLIDWDARGRGEGNFFINELRRRKKYKILDVATGTGYHSVKLLQNGFDVWSADGSPVMLAKAFENAKKRGKILKTLHADWRWLNRDVHGRFDAIICLGNSFTHLHNENDRRKSLAEYYSALKHDGILIIDHRNYDQLLDEEIFDNSHTYYYAGDTVKAEPSFVDEGLARFRYEFPDKSVFHLNMYPLRVAYMKRLMKEVGFQTITTYGDFREVHKTDNPDFYIHIAEKKYHNEQVFFTMGSEDLVNTTRSYYDSPDADNFYFQVWGGEDIHVGLYQSDKEPIAEASKRTVHHMMDQVPSLDEHCRVLDIGAGYGGAARSLVQKKGCQVTCLNLSEKENERNRQKNLESNLADKIKVKEGNFESLPFRDEQFDVIWCQDAILHSDNKDLVFNEVYRVLKKGGHFIVTDPMQADDCPDGVLDPILERIHLKELGSVKRYRAFATKLGMELVHLEELPEQLTNHYSRVQQELDNNREELDKTCSKEYLDKMHKGLGHWIEGGKSGHLNWGILMFKK